MKLLLMVLFVAFQLEANISANALILNQDNVGQVCFFVQEKRLLDCNYKKIIEISPNALTGVNPVFLDLKYHELEDLDPALFQSSLKTLWLTGNKLKSLPVNIFSSLKNLEKLFIEINQLSSLNADAFNDLSNLTILRLSYNRFSSLPGNVF